MKVLNVRRKKAAKPVAVVDCFVGSGYVQGPGGQLPDVDVDFQSDKRQEVKEYIEKRYNHDGKQRVFSAGTVTTLKAKAVIKDVARTMKISPSMVNYLTAIFSDSNMTYTDIFKLAYENKKVARFVADYPQLFEDIRTLMFQPRSSSIHASALLITPDTKDGEEMECFDFVPMKKVDGMLVSENDGYELDELGLLKNDCLATKELSKLHETISLANEHYGADLKFEEIVSTQLDDRKVYDLLGNGFTQNIFQFSSKGMTKFLTQLKPGCINDLIAANAIYRPATMGSLDEFLNRKEKFVAPTYFWGTYEALKDTFGLMLYQEQLSQIACGVGGFSLVDGVRLVKFISKKKQDKIDAMKDRFMKGAEGKGCPKEDADSIWAMFQVAGSYAFNRSHATAYAVTAYVGAWLKANYPTAFYTVALQWVDDDELVSLMSEMELCGNARVISPDINRSTDTFHTDYRTNEIFWSLSRIKQLGASSVQWIVRERERNGDFEGVENFIDRIFKYKLKKYKYWDDPDNEEEATRCPVNARHVLHLILAGCFDKVERAESNVERYAIMQKASERLGFKIKDSEFPEGMVGKHYFWSQKQIAVSSIGSIDYRRVFDNSEIKNLIKGRASYFTLKDVALFENEDRYVAICATVVDVRESKFTSKKTNETETFCKITVQQNNDLCECVVWPEEYIKHYGAIRDMKNKLTVFTAVVRYSDYDGKNNLQFNKRSVLEVI